MSVSSALSDGFVVAKRNLIKIKRVPDLLVFTTLQPIMFVLLFAYVFGGAIDVKGSNYKEFLIAGIFAQTVVFGTSVLEALGGFLILLVFAYAFSWVMAMVGLMAPSPEVVNNASFVVIFPLTFVANTFVPIDTLPGPLRTFAEWNPVSAVTEAARQLFGNIAPGTPIPDSWALQHPVTYTLLWALAILVIFVPLTTWQFRRAVSR